MRQGIALTTWGVIVGVAASLLATRGLATLLFGVSPIDPLTLAGVVMLLMAVSSCACFLPALRAARIDPSVTLRLE